MADAIANPTLTKPIIEKRISDKSHWKLVAYVRNDTSGIEFKLEPSRSGGNATAIPVDTATAAVLLQMMPGD
jgi:hypothetical protein